MNLGIIIPVRSTSTRFPQKHLAPIESRTLIEVLCARMQEVTNHPRVILAMPASDLSRGYVPIPKGVDAYGGRYPEGNVMELLYQTVDKFRLDTFVLVNGDSPLMCPRLIDRMLESFRYWEHELLENKGPSGFRAKVVDAVWYRRWVWAVREEPEHPLSLYSRFDYGPFFHFQQFEGYDTPLKFSVDTKRDLEFVRDVYREVGRFGTLQQIIEAGELVHRRTHNGEGDPTGHTPLDSAPDVRGGG